MSPSTPTARGLCGPVRDPCTGETFACGSCADGLACDVESTPAGRAQGRPAKISTPRAARSEYVRRAPRLQIYLRGRRGVQPPTPESLRRLYEPGVRGPRIRVVVQRGSGAATGMVLADYGACARGSVCNGCGFNRCEPAPASEGGDCVPLGAEVACANAKAECGFISDGCGNVLDCGDCPSARAAPPPYSPTRCSPPEETLGMSGRGAGVRETSRAPVVGRDSKCGSFGDGEMCNGQRA